MSRLRELAGALLVALAAGCSGHSCAAESHAGEREGGSTEPEFARETSVLMVPKATLPIDIDAELDEPSWATPARTGAFRDSARAIARPYSEARLLWDEQNLYLVLYAADENIQTSVERHDGPVWIDDAFSLRVSPKNPGSPRFSIDISAAGVITDARQTDPYAIAPSWESGIRVAMDRDGTPNDPSDDDEEWLVEAALPFEPLGIRPAPGTRIGIALSRCDTPRGGRRVCGAWNGSVELGP